MTFHRCFNERKTNEIIIYMYLNKHLLHVVIKTKATTIKTKKNYEKIIRKSDRKGHVLANKRKPFDDMNTYDLNRMQITCQTLEYDTYLVYVFR